MQFAIKLAKSTDQVPVAAVLSIEDKIISYAVNSSSPAWYHAEFLVIQRTLNSLQVEFLDNMSIYVTLEPCMFCASLLNMVRIGSIYFGAYNRFNNGLCANLSKLTHLSNIEILGGFSESTCQSLLRSFFQNKR